MFAVGFGPRRGSGRTNGPELPGIAFDALHDRDPHGSRGMADF